MNFTKGLPIAYLYLYAWIDQLKEPAKDSGKTWVLLVAGSSGWMNYRHQADVCHAYQIVEKHGVPRENIILMMKDDIAYNVNNPNKGVIINRPQGPDVYKNVLPDYNGENLRPDVFFNVLKGHNPGVGSRKFINSSSNDRIFLYFSDHGAPGILCLGDDYIMAQDIIDTITNMHKQKKFKEMVIYVEACEAGSLFNHLLLKEMNVYAMTATDSTHSSYACYYDKHLKTYLGDVYSVNWMEDSDVEDLTYESIERQFKIVQNETTTSNVRQYGNLEIAKLPLSKFQGKEPYYVVNREKPFVSKNESLDFISSRHVAESIIRKNGNEAIIEFTRAKRKFIENTFEAILKNTPGISSTLLDKIKTERVPFHECYSSSYYLIISNFNTYCFKLAKNEYVLNFLQYFVNVCSYNTILVNNVINSIRNTCSDYEKYSLQHFV